MMGEGPAKIDMRGRHGKHPKGSRHPRWNDSRIESEHGYVKVRVGVGHPLADPNGYAYEHLVVWVSAGNPRPLPTELLHHKNEDRKDNRLANLELMKRGDHNACHLKQENRRDDSTGRLMPKRTNAESANG